MDFSAQLVHHYPKLRDCGGYELLHIVGSTRSKMLEVLPCPKNGYSPMYLLSAEAGLGKATIYIRPLQKDLCLEPVRLLYYKFYNEHSSSISCYIQ